MRRIAMTIGLGALVGGGCLWGRFDDLKSKTWVSKIDRDEEKNQGAFGYAVTTLPVAQGAVVVASAGPPPSGLAVLTFDETGELSSFVGFDAEAPGIPSTVTPLVADAFPESLAPLSASSFALGTPNCRTDGGANCGTATKTISKHGADLTTPGTVLATGPASANGLDTGKWLRAGRLNAGSETDLVAVGVNAIVVVIDANSASPTTFSCEPGLEARGLAVGDLDGDGIDEIIVGYNTNTPAGVQIRAYSAQDVNAGCVGGATPNNVAWPALKEIGMSVGQLNGTGRPELVAGNVILLDFDPTVAAAQVTIPVPTGGADFGAKSMIGNLDGVAGNELIIADPRAVVGGEGGAGRVHVLKLNGTTTTQVTELFDPKPKEDLRFGRDIAMAPFPNAASSSNILVVGAKDQVYVYFQIIEGQTDPRGD
jgi:hypothetical protein